MIHYYLLATWTWYILSLTLWLKQALTLRVVFSWRGLHRLTLCSSGILAEGATSNWVRTKDRNLPASVKTPAQRLQVSALTFPWLTSHQVVAVSVGDSGSHGNLERMANPGGTMIRGSRGIFLTCLKLPIWRDWNYWQKLVLEFLVWHFPRTPYD